MKIVMRLFISLSMGLLLLINSCTSGVTTTTPEVISTTIAPTGVSPTTLTTSAVPSSATITSSPSSFVATTTAAAKNNPPSFDRIELTVNDAGSNVNVNFLASQIQRADSLAANLIYYIDVAPPTDQGKAAFSENGTYVVDQGLGQPIAWEKVARGKHTFSAQLVNANDNKPFDPPVICQNIITIVEPGSTAPAIRNMNCVVSFPNPSFVTPGVSRAAPVQVEVTCKVSHFNLNDDHIHHMNQMGEGHFIYYLDVPPLSLDGMPSTVGPGMMSYVTTNDFQTWPEVNAGEHTFTIQMVNNDDTPLNPPVSAVCIVTVPENL
jgi:hypothetical protein